MTTTNKFIPMPPHVRYYLNLTGDRRLRYLCYALKGKPLIYGIRCTLTNMIYIGSTLVPHDRLYQHLILGKHSNDNLQAAIDHYSLAKFSVLIFEFVTLPKGLSLNEKQAFLRNVEQDYIDMFPKEQLYNPTNAKAK